jgi:hypothetical protein
MSNRTSKRPPALQSTPSADSSAPGSLVQLNFRSHGSMLSNSKFLFSPRNFGIPNPPTCPVARLPPDSEEDEKIYTAFIAKNAVEAIIELREVPSSSSSSSSAAAPGGGTFSAQATPLGVTSAGEAAAWGSNVAAGASIADTTTTALRHAHVPWICRAVALTEREAQQSHGSISVHADVMKQIKFVSDRARGRVSARLIQDYAEAKRLYGLHAVQLTFTDQFLSRSDSIVVVECLQDQVIYVGQEIMYGGFRLRVQDLFMNGEESAPPTTPTGDAGTTRTNTSDPTKKKGSNMYSVPSGIVTVQTMVNFSSHAFVKTILVELSEEMWWPAIDGRISLQWVFERFLRQYAQQLPIYRSVPLVRVVLFGRLADTSLQVRDVYHVITMERSKSSLERLADEAAYHCQLFLARLLKESPTVQSARRLFVSSKSCNFLQAVNLVLRTYAAHNLDRRLDTTGQAIIILSAGKCLYAVDNDLSQITCARILDIGVKMCNVVIIGRPPLHSTPLFEISLDDPSLRSQYHLQLDAVHDNTTMRRVYVKPDWIKCFFFHAAPYAGGTMPKCELLSREQWEGMYPIYAAHKQQQQLPLHQAGASKSRAGGIVLHTNNNSRSGGGGGGGGIGEGCLLHYPGLSLPPVKESPLVLVPQDVAVRSSPLSVTLDSRDGTQSVFARIGSADGGGSSSTFLHRQRSPGDSRSVDEVNFGLAAKIRPRWYIRDKDRRVAVGQNILDQDVSAGNLTLCLRIECGKAPSCFAVTWNREILSSDERFAQLLSCFSVHLDDVFPLSLAEDKTSSAAYRRPSGLGLAFTSPNTTGKIKNVPVASPTGCVHFFRPEKMFRREKCAISGSVEDGFTLTLDASPVPAAPGVVCNCPEEVHFSCIKELLEIVPVVATASPPPPPPLEGINPTPPATTTTTTPPTPAALLEILALPSTGVIGYMQVQCAILFPVQPVNPYEASSQVIPSIQRKSRYGHHHHHHRGDQLSGRGAASLLPRRTPSSFCGGGKPPSLSSAAAVSLQQQGGTGEPSTPVTPGEATADSRYLTIDNLYKARWVHAVDYATIQQQQQDSSVPPATHTPGPGPGPSDQVSGTSRHGGKGGQGIRDRALSSSSVVANRSSTASSALTSATSSSSSSLAWQELCCCELLPLDGEKPRYDSDSLSTSCELYHIPPRTATTTLKELIIQRALQQYQLCSSMKQKESFANFIFENSSSNNTSKKKDTSSNTNNTANSNSNGSSSSVVVEMTIGHQHHIISYEKDINSIRVTRQVHRGMYLLPQSTNIVNYQYALWNYLSDEMQVLEVEIEAQTGGKNAYPWESLDRWLVMNSAVRSTLPPSSAGLKQRQICFALLPADDSSSDRPATFEEFNAFLSKRFSAKLRPKNGTGSVWKPYEGPLLFNLAYESGDELVADGGSMTSLGESVLAVVAGGGSDATTSRLGSPLATAGSLPDVLGGTSLTVSDAGKAPSALNMNSPGTPTSPAMMMTERTVVLEHVAQEEDFRTPINPSTGKTMFGETIQDRTMSVEITLSPVYTPHCAFMLEVSWLVASSTLIAEWTNAFVMNAPRSRLKVVRVPCRRDVQLGNPLQAAHVVEPIPDYRLDGIFREKILRTLIASHSYFSDSVSVDRNCRLIHSSGLSIVSSVGDVVMWCENYLTESGTTEQFAQYKTFRQVENTMRQQVLRGAEEQLHLAT